VVRPRLIVAVSSLTSWQVSSMGELRAEVVCIARPIDPQPFVDTLQSEPEGELTPGIRSFRPIHSFRSN
jgi:hypothetical protein